MISRASRAPATRVSYCRLVPGAGNSGGKTRHKRTTAGKRYLKPAFSHAAVRAIQYFPGIQQEYRRRARRRGKPVAQALIAEELATIVYAMLSLRDAQPRRTVQWRVLWTRPESTEASQVA